MNKSSTSFQSAQHINPKCITSQQLLSIMSRSQMNKQRLFKQLEQLDIDTKPLQGLTLSQVYNQTQPIMRNTYSIKYLGLNKNQMGIVSRRIDPTKDTESILNQIPNMTYTVNKYFYPKPLKTGKKHLRDEQINVQNLETEIKRQFDNTGAKMTNNKLKSTEDNEKKKKEVHGSWLSIGKVKNTIYNEKREKLKHIDSNRIDLNQLAQKQNKPQLNSYAKYLTKGIVLTKNI